MLNKLIKEKKLTGPAKASLWYTVCSIINKCIQFLTIPIFTRILTINEYGEYSVFISWQTIIIIIASLNIYADVFNNGLLKYKKDRKIFISSMQGLTTTISVMILCLFMIFHSRLSSFIGLPEYILYFMIIEIIFQSGFEFWASSERFDYRYKGIVIVTILVAVFNPIIGLIFVWNSTEKGYARIISVLLVQSVIYLIIYIYNFLKGKKFIQISYWKYILSLAIPLVPHYLSQILLNQMDRIMISSIVNAGKAGIYSVAYSSAMIMQIVGRAIQSSFTPWIYKKIENNDTQNIKKTANALILLVAFLNFCLICFAPEAIMILGGEQYKEAVYVIPPVICSCFLIFVYSMFCIIEFYYERAKIMMVVSVLGAIINYITNYIFITDFGYLAAGYTTLLSYIFFVMAHYIIMRKTLKDNDSKAIYDNRFIGFFSCIFIIMGIAMTLTYSMFLIRYIIMFVVVIAYLVYIKKYGMPQKNK